MNEGASLVDVEGIEVGHYTDPAGLTGLTCILLPPGSTASVDVRGQAPGTREAALLRPGRTVQGADAFLLTGGSAFGLDAAAGVMRYLAERGRGVRAGRAVIPIVPAGVIFDLGVGEEVFPTPRDAYRACLEASSTVVEEGNVGAGTGATVGKAMGIERATMSGVGTHSVKLPGGGTVAALVVVNALGNVMGEDGEVLAGVRNPADDGFLSAEQTMISRAAGKAPFNTTISVVATDASLDKSECRCVSEMAHAGMARSIRPCHTIYDGDLVFTAATGNEEIALEVVGVAAARVLEVAIRRAVLASKGVNGLPSARDISGDGQK